MLLLTSLPPLGAAGKRYSPDFLERLPECPEHLLVLLQQPKESMVYASLFSDVSGLYFACGVDSVKHLRSDSISLGGYSANMASGALMPLAGAVYHKLMASCPPLDQPNDTTLVGSGLTAGPNSDRVGNVSVAHFRASQQSVIGPSNRFVSGQSR